MIISSSKCLASGYEPISDYGAIGNLKTVALVSKKGSIDWLCLPELDSPSIFGALLDRHKGGRFKLHPENYDETTQSYLSETNVLLTEFRSSYGFLSKLIDFMPMRLDHFEISSSKLTAPPVLYRILEHYGSASRYVLEWSPRFDYGRQPAWIARTEFGAIASLSSHEKIALVGPIHSFAIFDDQGYPRVQASFKLKDGDRIAFKQIWSSYPLSPFSLDNAYQALEETCQAWRGWLWKNGTLDRDWTDRAYKDLLVRSELALKLMIHSETGAIAAAPTTSLPEEIGGVRNWDYRYGWIRDAALTAQALIAIGHPEEAREFLRWIERVSLISSEESELRIMYGIHGDKELHEETLKHWEGYCKSKPVRIGNAAYQQTQLDIFGEILNTGYELIRSGEKLSPRVMNFLSKAAEHAFLSWNDKDHGVWEVRGPLRHYVHSRMMLWTALDRAVLMSLYFGLKGDIQAWSRRRDQLIRSILKQGFDRELNSFVQSFGSKELDAATLLIPVQELLPAIHPMVQGTIAAIQSQLMTHGLVYRYRMDDGLPGVEGAFVPCTFWLTDVLALSGRLDEAYKIFEGILSRTNHVGLLSEEIDPITGEFLGNFPQAFSHIGLINSLLYLAHTEKRKTPVIAPLGTVEHRKWVVSSYPHLVRRAG